jgi:hypothetical protein
MNPYAAPFAAFPTEVRGLLGQFLYVVYAGSTGVYPDDALPTRPYHPFPGENR